MRKIFEWILASAILALLFLTHPSQAEEAAPLNADVANLCQSHTEGSASATVGGKRQARINVLCIDKDRFAASVYIEGMLNLSLTYSSVSKGLLTLSQFPLELDQRKGTSTTTMTYLKLNIRQLKLGHVRGYIMNGNLTFPLEVKGEIQQRFPSVLAMKSTTVGHHEFIGLYKFQLQRPNVRAPEDVEMWVDINKSIPIVNMKVAVPLSSKSRASQEMGTASLPGGTAIHFIDGSVWDSKIGFDATTTFSDASVTGVALWHLRGRVLAPGQLEIYIIDPVNGLRGPAIANRTADPRNYLKLDVDANELLEKTNNN